MALRYLEVTLPSRLHAVAKKWGVKVYDEYPYTEVSAGVVTGFKSTKIARHDLEIAHEVLGKITHGIWTLEHSSGSNPNCTLFIQGEWRADDIELEAPFLECVIELAERLPPGEQ